MGSMITEKVKRLDWDFPNEGSDFGPHSIHPFPAKFIPQIPRQILSIFEVPAGTVVLDPFVGSGTTILEAKVVGLDYVGIDVNPVAVLISRVKTTDLPGAALSLAGRVASGARARFRSRGPTSAPQIPRLEHWFSETTARAMACLRDEISNLNSDSASADFLRVCLSAITVKVSKQENETRYAAIEKSISGEGVFDLFLKTANSVAAKLATSQTLFNSRRGHGQVICFDSRRIGELRLPRVSLVITSPPYPNAFEYWLYNKYRMYWLGFDPVAVREKEIGARPHYSGPRGDSIETFLGDIRECFRGISVHLADEAYVALLIGSTCRIRKTVFALPTLLSSALTREGYEFVMALERKIPRTRKAFNPVIGSIESETLLILRWRSQ